MFFVVVVVVFLGGTDLFVDFFNFMSLLFVLAIYVVNECRLIC